jgi:hypothetical protein
MSNELAVKVPPLSSLEVLTATWHASCTGEFMRLLMRIIVLVVCLTVLLTVLFVNLQQRKSNDLFVVIVNGKRGFINRSGEMIIQPKWIGANSFSEDRAVVAVDSWSLTQGMDRLITTYGYIDITGKLVIPAVYDYAGDF